MTRSRLFVLFTCAAAGAALVAGGVSNASASPPPTYDHVFVIVEENHSFTDVIPNPAAPNLNALAAQYGVATNYFGITHPSEPNYVALLGGSFFGIQDDNPYWMTANTINSPNLMSELDAKGVSWKAYLDGSPHAGYKGMCYPVKCNGSPDIDPLYVSKHDAIQNFIPARTTADWARQVPIGQLSADLASGNVPRFGYVIPSECLDMHGDPPYCIDSGNPFDPQDQHLVSVGDQYLGQLVSGITGAGFWAAGNNAVVVIFDEGDDNAGGGGRVASVVVTSHGPRAISDANAFNHYSLLRTLQNNFGVGCLANSCSAAPMNQLFTLTGSAAQAFAPLAQASWPTPTPTPKEKQTYTTLTPSSGGWSVVNSPLLGTNDNSLGAVAASAPNDVWALGNFVPDTATSNQDATITLASHWDGNKWKAVETPNTGVNYNTLFGAAASGGQAWGVGVYVNGAFQARALIESWNGKTWSVVSNPQPGTQRDILFSASATSPSDAWAAGEQQGADGKFMTLVEHWDGSSWSVSASANPGDAGDSFYGVFARSASDVWAVGQSLSSSGTDRALIEHFNGTSWSVVAAPAGSGFASSLYSITGSEHSLIAVGETDSLTDGSRPFVETFNGVSWQIATLPAGAGSQFSALWSAAAGDGTTWAVGTQFDVATGNMHTLVLRGNEQGWTIVQTPNPTGATDDNILAGVVSTGDGFWAVGHYKDNGRKTLIERNPEV
jgi:hypothetical protein